MISALDLKQAIYCTFIEHLLSTPEELQHCRIHLVDTSMHLGLFLVQRVYCIPCKSQPCLFLCHRKPNLLSQSQLSPAYTTFPSAPMVTYFPPSKDQNHYLMHIAVCVYTVEEKVAAMLQCCMAIGHSNLSGFLNVLDTCLHVDICKVILKESLKKTWHMHGKEKYTQSMR